MTIEAWTRPDLALIQSAGPFAIPHPYAAGTIRATILRPNGSRRDLLPSEFTVTPEAAEAEGNLTLSGAVFLAESGNLLSIQRETDVEQGWEGKETSRERGLERQLDITVMALQELRGALRNTARGFVEQDPIVPRPGRLLAFDDQGRIVAGPDASTAMNVQGAVDDAVDAAADALAALGQVQELVSIANWRETLGVADGVQTVWTLPHPVTVQEHLSIWFDGHRQHDGFTVAGAVLTFTAPPPFGVTIRAQAKPGLSGTQVQQVLNAPGIVQAAATQAVQAAKLTDVSASIAQGINPVFATKALADAGAVAPGQYCVVLADETRGGRRTIYQGGAPLVFVREFERDIDYVSLRDFGGVPDGSFSTFTGTDNTGAFLLAKATGKPILIDGVYRIATPSAMILSGNETLIGQGPNTGLVVQCGATESGILVASAARIENMRVQLFTSGSKPANNGQLQSVIQVGSGYLDYLPTYDLPQVSGWHLSNLLLTRASLGGGGGSAIYIMGNAPDGYLGHIRDDGSALKHSFLVAVHWAGKTVAPGGYGNEVLATWHPRDILMGPLRGVRSRAGMFVSSVSNIVQRGEIYLDGVENAFSYLAGDEGASKAVISPELIGKGVDIGGPIIVRNPSPSGEGHFVQVLGTGGSVWDFVEPGIRRWVPVESDVKIGDISIFGTIAPRRALEVNLFWGRLKVGKVSLFGNAGAETRTVNVEYVFPGSEVTIEEINTAGGSQQISIRRARGVRVLGGRVVSATTGTGDYTTYVFGETISRVLAVDASAGATSLTLTEPVHSNNRIMQGVEVVVGGTVLTRLTRPFPGLVVSGLGSVTVPVEPLPAGVTAGQTVEFRQRSEASFYGVVHEGGGRTVEVSGADVVFFGGKIRRGWVNGARLRDGTVANISGVGFEGNGRIGSGGRFDIDVPNQLNRVTMTGGYLGGGIGPSAVTHNLQFNDTEGTHRRFTGIGVQFRGNVTGEVTASSTNNYTLIGCVDRLGNLLSNP
jgi:hypothetical protein